MSNTAEQVSEGYRQTEIGVVPNEWDIVSIDRAITERIIVDQMDGNHGELYPKSHEFSDSGIPYVGATDFDGGTINYKDCKFIPEKRAALFKKGIAKNGDVLFAHNATVGPVAMVETDLDYIILSTTATYYRCDNKSLINNYLKAYFESEYFVGQYTAVMSQSTRNQVPILAQRKFFLVLPPIEEQTAIAIALSDVDALITSLEKLITKKRAIKTAAMQQLLTGKKRLPPFDQTHTGYKQTELGEIPKDWEVVTMREILKFLSDYTANGSFESLKVNVQYYSSENHAVLLRTTDLDKEIFRPERFTDKRGYDFLKKTALFGGEIIIANVGSVGKVFRVPKYRMPMTLAPNTYVLKFSELKANEDYIYQWMKTNDFVEKLLSKVGSTTLLAINKDNLRDIVLVLPKSLDEQALIASYLWDMDKDIKALTQRLIKTQQLRQGMMQELLTGRTRLV